MAADEWRITVELADENGGRCVPSAAARFDATGYMGSCLWIAMLAAE